MEELAGRTAVITGGASGIGLAMARRFGAAGMQLMLADIEAAPLEAARADLAAAGHEVATFEIDVRNLDEIEALEAATRERFGGTHVLCNNAGVGSGGPIAGDPDLEIWKWVMDINVWGVVYGCRTFVPRMVESGEPCHVINTASMAGLVPAPMMAPYTMSKYSVVALSETLSIEMQSVGADVGVSVLCPAFVRTGIAESRRNLPSDLDRPADRPADPARSEIEGAVKAMVDAGIDPAEVADAVHDAVVNDAFWILTHEESRAAVSARTKAIVENAKPSFLGY